MIMNPNDSTGGGLFSKCARNLALKRSKKTNMEESLKPKSTKLYSHHSHRAKIQIKKTICSFDMQETRDQRMKKYHQQVTPAVGQYNPKIQQKAKYIWDILKAHQNRSKRRVQTEEKQRQETAKEKKVEKNINKTSEDIHISHKTIERTIRSSQNRLSSIQPSVKPTKENRRYQTVKSLTKSRVDMSKMTGRQKELQMRKDEEQLLNEEEIDINKSIKYIKNKTSSNINFAKQISREKINRLSQKKITPSDYTYNIDQVKKKDASVVGFNKMVGRSERTSKNLVYSYTHYDYDGYVWKGDSKIFPNTKTSVANFKQQRGRDDD